MSSFRSIALTSYLWPRYWHIWLGLGCLRLVILLPWAWRLAFGRAIGWVLYQLSDRRRHIVCKNIALCFPDLPAWQRQQLIQNIFASNGMGVVETAMAWWSPSTQLKAKTVILGGELIQQAQAAGVGILLVGAHYTTLDLGGILLSHSYPYHATYQRHSNGLINAIIQRGRLRYLPGTVERNDIRKVIKLLRQGQIVWLAPDQDMGPERSLFAFFFGIATATTAIVSRLARNTGARVLLFSHHRNDDNRGYTLRLSTALASITGADQQADTQCLNSAIEAEVRRYPEQYLWLHRRFKTRPPGDETDFYS